MSNREEIRQLKLSVPLCETEVIAFCEKNSDNKKLTDSIVFLIRAEVERLKTNTVPTAEYPRLVQGVKRRQFKLSVPVYELTVIDFCKTLSARKMLTEAIVHLIKAEIERQKTDPTLMVDYPRLSKQVSLNF